MNWNVRRIGVRSILVIALPLVVSGATLDHTPADPPEAVQAGLVFQPPRTGAEPTIEDPVFAAVRANLNMSDQGLEIIEHPNGMRSVDLQGRFMSYSLARVDRDGNLEQFCVTSAEELDRHVQTPQERTR